MQLGPMGGAEVFKKRREQLLQKIKGGVVVLAAAPEYIRNNDVHHSYRQDSTFYYLTGFTEPEAVCILNPQSTTPFTLFVRPKDPTRELWDGFRYGTDGTKQHFGADQVYTIDEFDKLAPELLKGSEKVYYRFNEDREFDEKMLSILQKVRTAGGRTGRGLAEIADAKSLIGEMRLVKSAHEIDLLRKAGEISAEGHIAAMRHTAPGKWEYEIQAECEAVFKRRGSERLGYGSIVATGRNATVLHYVFNNAQLKDGELLLLDAGAEWGYMSGDITRTWPVNGKFTQPQRKLYEAVLRVQKACIDFVKPGKRLADIHQFAISGLVEGLLEMGLLKGTKEKLIEEKKFMKYFPHGTGHWLGMDVHDSGLYQVNGEPRKLEAGMCFTIEPGLYVPADDQDAPADLRGTGIRIEDDVVVTASGCEVLTSKVPKEIDEMEALIGKDVRK